MSGLRERNRRAAMAEVQRAAFRLMRREGFDEVTVEHVAAESGVSPSTVYRYFGTKEALILWGERPQRLVAALGDSNGKDPVERFRRAALEVYDDADAGELLAQLKLTFANDSLSATLEHELLGRRRAVAEIFANARRSDAPAVRDDALAGACLGVLVAVLDRWQASDGDKSLKKMLTKGLDQLG